MGLLSTLLSASHSRYHKLSSSDPPNHRPRRNHCTASPCTNPHHHHHHHNPIPNHRRRVLDMERQDRHEARKADWRYEAARQQEIDLAKAQKAARVKVEKEERRREEEAREVMKLRFQAVGDKKEKNRREGELWRGRFDGKNLEGYCLHV